MFIVVEGIDGSGKGTQSQLLVDHFKSKGLSTRLFSFPQYEKTSYGGVIGRYLNGDFGDDVHPELISMAYAIDRLEAREELEAHIAVQDVVVCDRYVPSNIAHQCARLESAESDALAERLLRLEHELFKLPCPDVVVGLDLAVPLAQRLIAKKSQRAYTDKSHDAHEADAEYLTKVLELYRKMPATYGQYCPYWAKVEVADGESADSRIRDIWDVHQNILVVLPPMGT